MNIYNTPYTYLIGWSNQSKYYYGVRYANKSNPDDDLWKSYFTSSHYVAEHRKLYGEPDIIQIRKTFDDAQQALDWEDKVLKRLDVMHRPDFFNKSNNKYFVWDDDVRSKLSKAHMGKKLTEEHKAKISKWQKTKTIDAEYRKKISDTKTGVPRSPEARKAISLGQQKREKIKCPHCEVRGFNGNMYRWHFDNCKQK